MIHNKIELNPINRLNLVDVRRKVLIRVLYLIRRFFVLFQIQYVGKAAKDIITWPKWFWKVNVM